MAAGFLPVAHAPHGSRRRLRRSRQNASASKSASKPFAAHASQAVAGGRVAAGFLLVAHAPHGDRRRPQAAAGGRTPSHQRVWSAQNPSSLLLSNQKPSKSVADGQTDNKHQGGAIAKKIAI